MDAMQPIILVVENEPIVALVKRLLADEGLDVQVANSAHAAIGQINEASRYAAAIVGLSLPDMSGEEVVRSIRQYHPCLPVVVTTDGDYHSIEKRFHYDIRLRVLEKPVDSSALMNALKLLKVKSSAGTPEPFDM